MTVREFIEELQKLDPNMIVVVGGCEDYADEPCINIKKYEFRVLYWSDNMQLKAIPENTEFIEL